MANGEETHRDGGNRAEGVITKEVTEYWRYRHRIGESRRKRELRGAKGGGKGACLRVGVADGANQ